MTISVVTVVKNDREGLERTIRSVLGQRYGDIEYVVVDGASVDGTVDVIRHFEIVFGNRLVWISEPDRGIYDAMNKGIALASGDVVGFLNAGDVFYDCEAVGKIVERFFSDSKLECVYGNLIFVNGNGRLRREWKGSQYEVGLFERGWQPAHPTFYARKGCYERCGLYDTRYRIAADFDLIYRMLAVHGCKSLYVPATLVKMRAWGTSTRSLGNIIRSNRETLRILKSHGARVPWWYVASRLAPKLWNFLRINLAQIP